MSIRTRLHNAAAALLGEPGTAAKTLLEQQALTEYERTTRRRYATHLDDIRCDLADAGIAIPEDDDPELTPRRMVRALIECAAGAERARGSARAWTAYAKRVHGALDLAGVPNNGSGLLTRVVALQAERDALRTAAPTKPAPKVPEARLSDLLRMMDLPGDTIPLTASEIADVLGDNPDHYPAFRRLTLSSIARIVSDVAALGYLQSDGRKPLRYLLTAQGRAALAGDVAVAS